MIDTAEKAREVSFKDVRIAVGKAFCGHAGVSRNAAGELQVWIRPKAYRSPSGASPAKFVSAVMRQVSGRSIAAADEIAGAAGLETGRPSLVPRRGYRHRFEIRGYESVEVLVHNAGSQDEALMMAHEAIGSMLAGRRAREVASPAEDASKEQAPGVFPRA